MMKITREKSEFARLALQLIAQSLVTALVGAADAIMTGVLDQNALSAISLAGQVMQLYSFIIMALCVGSTVLASQYYGIDDLESVRKVMNITLKTSMSCAAVFFAMCLGAPRLLMSFFTDEPVLIEIGTPYLRLISPAFLFMGFSQIYINIMKNTGSAKQSSIFGCVTSILNIILNYILIFGRCGLPQMGVAGAAAATSISRAVELILAVIFSQRGAVRFSLKGFFKSSSGIKRKYWRYTLPSLVQLSSWKLANACAVAVIGHLGNDVVAASAFALIVYSVLCSIADGYGNACGIWVGRYLGRGETQKAKQTGDRLLSFSLVLALLVGIATCLCCPLLLRANSVMTEGAKHYLRIMIFFAGFRCIGKYFNTTLAMGLFSAGGDVLYLLKLDIVNMWLVTLPLGLLAAYVLHLPPIAVYFILNLDEFYKLAIMFRRYKRYYWVKNLTKKEWAPPGKYEENVRAEIFKRMPVGVIVVSAAGRIGMVNPAAAELLGCDVQDIEGSNYMDFFMNDPENSALADLVIETVEDKEAAHEAVVDYHKDGGLFPICVQSSFLEDEDCRMGICLMLTSVKQNTTI